ncbi:MAG TPA: ISNCY family transposase [Verrucomicrobiae bacterium]|nr:ISNCY family transposase [Verrucomicrobiae bacterium]
MSQKERTRLGVMQQVKAQKMTLVAAAEVLGLGYRQLKRVWRRYRKEGDKGLVHRGRGRASNRATAPEVKQRVLRRYEQRYAGFGPTLACEHLSQEGLKVDHETLRRWLLAKGSWTIQRRRQKHRQQRERKPCFGQMVQMDGSEHDWFEGRAGRAVLMVMIDDATNRTYARFAEGETTRAAYDVFEGYVRKYGLPQGLYVDRDSIYKTTREPSIAEQLAGEQPLTQFGRAMKQLGVDLDLAYSPQAKGRVERRNGLLQDRLVKELRLAGISELEAANAFLEEQFLSQLNRRFCVEPAQPADVHRGVPRQLKEVLSWEEERVVQQDWTVSWQGRYFQIAQAHEDLCLAKKTIIVRELRDGTIQLVWGGQKLQWKELSQRPVRVAKPKAPRQTVLVAPAKDHPWRGFGMGVGQEFWRGAKARGRAARQAARGLRSASASLRPPCVPGLPAKQSVSVGPKQKGDIFS